MPRAAARSAGRTRGSIIYDSEFGHVCTCSVIATGHDAPPAFRNTVAVADDVAPTDSGSWWYVCSACGSGAWSGC